MAQTHQHAPTPTARVSLRPPVRQWLIDAFASAPFRGNSACVVEPQADWPDPAWMQALAMENQVGATAFLVRTDMPGRFALRWFTPAVEVPLCGHATLAAAHLLFADLPLDAGDLAFETRSGLLTVRRSGEGYEMELPRPTLRRIRAPAGLARALGATPRQTWAGPYLVALFDDPQVVADLRPDTAALRWISLALGGQGNVGVAAPAGPDAPYDVIDRFFAPGYGIPEDPATGSFHALLTAILTPAGEGGPIRFHQAFPGRGADLEGRLDGDRVLLRGRAVTIAEHRLTGALP